MSTKRIKVTVNDTEYEAEINGFDKEGIEVLLNGTRYNVSFAEIEAHEKRAVAAPEPITLPRPVQPTVEINSDHVTAPLPGDVVEILVEAGAAIEVGQGVIVLESMKMKNIIRSSRTGTVKRVLVSPGQAVAYGDLLVEFE